MQTGTWKTAPCETSACVKIRPNVDGTISIGSTEDTLVLTVTRAEWDAFVTGVNAGEFDL